MEAKQALSTEQKKQIGGALSSLKSTLQTMQKKYSSGNALTTNDIKQSKNFELTQPKPSTATAGALATIEGLTGTDQFTQDVNREKEIAGIKTGSAFEQYLGRLTGAKTLSEMEAENYSRDFGGGSVDLLQQQVDDYQTQLEAEQHSLVRRLEELDKNKEGYFGGALEAEKARVEKDSLRKQADLAVIQLSLQRRYDSAKTVADRYVDAAYEREQNITEAVRINYEANKEIFTRAEQRAFETNLGNRERKLTQEREDAKKLSDTKIDALKMAQANGAPASIVQAIQTATTPEGVLQAGGKWASADLLQQEAQRASIAASNTSRLLALANAGSPSAIRSLGFDPRQKPADVQLDATTKRQYETQLNGKNRLINLSTQYRDLIKKVGYTNTVFGNSATLGQIDSLRTQITAAYKEAEALGALDAGVQNLVNGVLGAKPTSSIFGIGEEGNIFSNITGRRSAATVASLDTLIQNAQTDRDDLITKLGYTPISQVTNNLSNTEINSINKAFGVTGTSANSTVQFSPSNYFK